MSTEAKSLDEIRADYENLKKERDEALRTRDELRIKFKYKSDERKKTLASLRAIGMKEDETPEEFMTRSLETLLANFANMTTEIKEAVKVLKAVELKLGS